MRRTWAIAFLLVASACDISGLEIHKGLLDLREWRQTGTVRLDGQWEFYWKQLLRPEQVESGDKLYIDLPRSWRKYRIAGKELGSQGFATYRLKIHVSPIKGTWALQLENIQAGFKVFVNGNAIAEQGRVGKSPEQSFGIFRPKTVFFHDANGSIDVLIQVSNFRHWRGGIKHSVKFGTAQAILDDWFWKQTYNNLFTGAFLLASFFNFLTFVYRREARAALHFSFVCLLLAAFIGIFHQHSLVRLFDINWELNTKLIYLSYVLPIVSYLLYLKVLFPNEVSDLVLRALQIFIASVSVIVVMTPAIVYQPLTLTPYYLVVVVYLLYSLFVLVFAAIRKRPGSVYNLAPCVFCVAFLIHDILRVNEIITSTAFMLPWGVFGFIAFTTAFLASRYALSYKEVLGAKVELEKSAKQLAELHEAKDKYLQEIFNLPRELFNIDRDKLMYVRAGDKHCFFHCDGDEGEPAFARIMLGECLKFLGDRFVRVQRSYLLNLDYALTAREKRKGEYEIPLKNQKDVIPIGPKYLAEIRSDHPRLIPPDPESIRRKKNLRQK